MEANAELIFEVGDLHNRLRRRILQFLSLDFSNAVPTIEVRFQGLSIVTLDQGWSIGSPLQSKHTPGIRRVHLAQHLAGQVQAVDVPAPLVRCRAERIVEVLVPCFEEAVIQAVGFLAGGHVGAEQDAASVLEEEVSGGKRLPAEFANAGADVDVEVGRLVEQVPNPPQIFGVAADVGADEGRARVVQNDPGKGFHNGTEGWEGR